MRGGVMVSGAIGTEELYPMDEAYETPTPDDEPGGRSRSRSQSRSRAISRSRSRAKSRPRSRSRGRVSDPLRFERSKSTPRPVGFVDQHLPYTKPPPTGEFFPVGMTVETHNSDKSNSSSVSRLTGSLDHLRLNDPDQARRQYDVMKKLLEKEKVGTKRSVYSKESSSRRESDETYTTESRTPVHTILEDRPGEYENRDYAVPVDFGDSGPPPSVIPAITRGVHMALSDGLGDEARDSEASGVSPNALRKRVEKIVLEQEAKTEERKDTEQFAHEMKASTRAARNGNTMLSDSDPLAEQPRQPKNSKKPICSLESISDLTPHGKKLEKIKRNFRVGVAARGELASAPLVLGKPVLAKSGETGWSSNLFGKPTQDKNDPHDQRKMENSEMEEILAHQHRVQNSWQQQTNGNTLFDREPPNTERSFVTGPSIKSPLSVVRVHKTVRVQEPLHSERGREHPPSAETHEPRDPASGNGTSQWERPRDAGQPGQTYESSTAHEPPLRVEEKMEAVRAYESSQEQPRSAANTQAFEPSQSARAYDLSQSNTQAFGTPHSTGANDHQSQSTRGYEQHQGSMKFPEAAQPAVAYEAPRAYDPPQPSANAFEPAAKAYVPDLTGGTFQPQPFQSFQPADLGFPGAPALLTNAVASLYKPPPLMLTLPANPAQNERSAYNAADGDSVISSLVGGSLYSAPIRRQAKVEQGSVPASWPGGKPSMTPPSDVFKKEKENREESRRANKELSDAELSEEVDNIVKSLVGSNPNGSPSNALSSVGDVTESKEEPKGYTSYLMGLFGMGNAADTKQDPDVLSRGTQRSEQQAIETLSHRLQAAEKQTEQLQKEVTVLKEALDGTGSTSQSWWPFNSSNDAALLSCSVNKSRSVVSEESASTADDGGMTQATSLWGSCSVMDPISRLFRRPFGSKMAKSLSPTDQRKRQKIRDLQEENTKLRKRMNQWNKKKNARLEPQNCESEDRSTSSSLSSYTESLLTKNTMLSKASDAFDRSALGYVASVEATEMTYGPRYSEITGSLLSQSTKTMSKSGMSKSGMSKSGMSKSLLSKSGYKPQMEAELSQAEMSQTGSSAPSRASTFGELHVTLRSSSMSVASSTRPPRFRPSTPGSSRVPADLLEEARRLRGAGSGIKPAKGGSIRSFRDKINLLRSQAESDGVIGKESDSVGR